MHWIRAVVSLTIFALTLLWMVRKARDPRASLTLPTLVLSLVAGVVVPGGLFRMFHGLLIAETTVDGVPRIVNAQGIDPRAAALDLGLTALTLIASGLFLVIARRRISRDTDAPSTQLEKRPRSGAHRPGTPGSGGQAGLDEGQWPGLAFWTSESLAELVAVLSLYLLLNHLAFEEATRMLSGIKFTLGGLLQSETAASPLGSRLALYYAFKAVAVVLMGATGIFVDTAARAFGSYTRMGWLQRSLALACGTVVVLSLAGFARYHFNQLENQTVAGFERELDDRKAKLAAQRQGLQALEARRVSEERDFQERIQALEAAQQTLDLRSREREQASAWKNISALMDMDTERWKTLKKHRSGEVWAPTPHGATQLALAGISGTPLALTEQRSCLLRFTRRSMQDEPRKLTLMRPQLMRCTFAPGATSNIPGVGPNELLRRNTADARKWAARQLFERYPNWYTAVLGKKFCATLRALSGDDAGKHWVDMQWLDSWPCHGQVKDAPPEGPPAPAEDSRGQTSSVEGNAPGTPRPQGSGGKATPGQTRADSSPAAQTPAPATTGNDKTARAMPPPQPPTATLETSAP